MSLIKYCDIEELKSKIKLDNKYLIIWICFDIDGVYTARHEIWDFRCLEDFIIKHQELEKLDDKISLKDCDEYDNIDYYSMCLKSENLFCYVFEIDDTTKYFGYRIDEYTGIFHYEIVDDDIKFKLESEKYHIKNIISRGRDIYIDPNGISYLIDLKNGGIWSNSDF